jgi:hypothetical protein
MPVLDDELLRGRPALGHLFLLVQEAGRRQHDAVHVAARLLDRVLQREHGPDVVLGHEAAVHVAGADAQFQHHRRSRRFRQLEALLDHRHDAGQVGPRVEQPDLRLHREGVRALLHDAGALAIVFAHDQHRAAGDPARGQIGQRVGSDIGADRGLEGDGAAQRVVDRGGQRGGGRGFAGTVLEVHAQVFQDVVRVGQHVHQVRDGRALITGHVRHPGLQQGLGHREDSLAAELLAGAQPELADFTAERTLRHCRDPSL